MMNLDLLGHFENQNLENRKNSCIGESVTDAVGNLLKVQCDPDYTMATSFYVQGKAASTLGTNLYAAMLGAIAYGLLPDSKDRSDPLQTSELYEDTYSNYSEDQKQFALRFLPPGGLPQRLNTFSDIAKYLETQKMGVPLVIRWHPEFNNPGPNRVFSMPHLPQESNHCVVAYEVTDAGLKIKPFLGEEYGYAYLPPNVFNAVISESYGFVPGNRQFTLLYITLWRISIYLSSLTRV